MLGCVHSFPAPFGSLAWTGHSAPSWVMYYCGLVPEVIVKNKILQRRDSSSKCVEPGFDFQTVQGRLS